MTIKIERQVTETISVTLELPAYRKYGQSFIKIIGEEHYIKVDAYNFSLGLEIRKAEVPWPYLGKEAKEISEEEFEAALQDVSDNIKVQIEQSFATA